MTRSHVHPDPTQPARRGGAAPWAIFVLAMVVVMTAGLVAVMISLPQSGDQTRSPLHAGLPFPPNFKMPAPPPMPHG